MLRKLMRKLIIISWPITFILRINGAVLIKECTENVSNTSFLDTKAVLSELHEDQESIEEHISLNISILEIPSPPGVAIRSVIPVLDPVQLEGSLLHDPTGLLDPQILQEASRLHPVNLLWTGVSDNQTDHSTGPIVGIGVTKSDRVWRSGRLFGLCGIKACIQSPPNENCRLLYFDQYGIRSNSTEAILLALEKVRWEMFGMKLKLISPADQANVLSNEYSMSMEQLGSEEEGYQLSTVVLHLWLESQEETSVLLPLSGINGVVRNCIEAALCEIKEQLKNRMQGIIERKLVLAADHISQSIASIVSRSRCCILQNHICSTLNIASTRDVPLKMKSVFEEAARNAFQKKHHQNELHSTYGIALAQPDQLSSGHTLPHQSSDGVEPEATNPEDWMF
eukprot:g27.t1